MNYSPKQERGLTFISLVFLLSLVGFFVLLGLKIIPIYIDHRKVLSSLKAMEAMPNLSAMTPTDIRNSIAKRFSMDYVSTINYNDVQITKRGAYVKIQTKYEVVEKIMGNASVLVNFDDVVEVGEDK